MGAVDLRNVPDNSASIPTWIHKPLWSNIAQTFNAVVPVTGASPVSEAAFVGKSQICSGIKNSPSDYVYVEFTGGDYLLTQNAVITPNASGDSLTVVEALYNNIQYRKQNGSWSVFLAGHCYF